MLLFLRTHWSKPKQPMTKRFYLDTSLKEGTTYSLPVKLDHYVRHVLRLKDGDCICVFNGRDGAWKGLLHLEKRVSSVQCMTFLSPPHVCPPLGLAFCPIKTERLFFLIEKATELGVTDFFPLQTDYTQGHLKLNIEKIHDQMIATTQQCERFDIPTLHAVQPFDAFLKGSVDKSLWHLFIAVERACKKSSAPLRKKPFSCVVVGPEGGWSAREKAMILQTQDEHMAHMDALYLGDLILRSETAALSGITLLQHAQ